MNTRLREVSILYPEFPGCGASFLLENRVPPPIVPIITLGGDSSSPCHVFVIMVSVFPRALSSNSVAVIINLGVH